MEPVTLIAGGSFPLKICSYVHTQFIFLILIKQNIRVSEASYTIIATIL
jgi:hypothetical protein